MKKIISLVLVVAMLLTLCVAFTGCGSSNEGSSDFKVGFIFLHDENSTYDKNFMVAAEEAKKELGLTDDQVIFKTNIPEGNECYEAAADLADQGCSVVFADSFGHEPFIAKAAKEFPNVQFCHATGTTAHTAGLKLNEMIANGEFTADEAKMGYVGAFTYAEVMSGYTSFFLGARSVCPTVTMEVQFTGTWYDEALEKEAATKLINNGCKLISQHADSWGAPTACENANVPNVSYNGSTVSACPNTFIVSSRINWAPYFVYMINSVKDGTKIDVDWSKGIAEGSVELSEINEKAAAKGTKEKLEEVKKAIVDGTLNVFDTKTFTVEGKTLTSYKADVDTDEAYTPDTEVIENGVFAESKFRSAPCFDLRIDGITLLNEMF